MEKERDIMCKHVNIGQLPRFSRPIRVYLHDDNTEYLEPIHTWSHNLSVIKGRKEEEEKLVQKCLTFTELCNVINESKDEVILKNLNLLYGIAQELSKDEQPEILSSAVLFFFKLFIGVSGLLM